MTTNITAEHTEHLTHPKYRTDIDGLRAIAVLSVVIYHAFPKFIKGGFIGVDIFFVISGYLISTIIIGSLERNNFNFFEFYSRRIKRIFPALILVLMASLAFGWFALLADEYKQLGKHIAGGAGFISNFLFWNESGYFDNAAETKPLLHLWSLGVEEQFYIIWPLMLWVAWKKRFNLLAITIVIATISFALSIYKTNVDIDAAFYSPLTRFWELLTGSVLAYITIHRQSVLKQFEQKPMTYFKQSIHQGLVKANIKNFQNIQSAIGATLILIGLLMTKKSHFPGWWAIFPTIGALLIISAGTQAWFNRTILSNKVMVWFGLISFPLYLWHWPLLSFAQIIEADVPSRKIRISIVFLSIALAWLTYKFIEKPLRFGKSGRFKILAFIMLMFTSGFAGYAIYNRNGLTPHNKSFINITSAAGEWHYPGNMQPFQFHGRTYLTQLSSSKKTTLFLGDSNIEQYYVRTDELIKRSPKTTNSVIFPADISGCSPIPNTIAYEYKHCDDLMEQSLQLAISRDDISTVVIGSQWYGNLKQRINYNFISDEKSYPITEGSEGYKLALDSLSKWIKTLKDNKKTVYLVLNIPIGEELNPRHMIQRSFLEFPTMMHIKTAGLDYKTFKVKYGGIKNDLINLAKNSGAIVIDPEQSLCNSFTCVSVDTKGDPLYKDSTHLRPSYVRNHAKFIDETLQCCK